MPTFGPAIVFAVLLGIFWAAGAVLVGATGGARLPFVLVVSILGAWAGDAIGGRVGGRFDLVRLGDFRLVPASAGAIGGIALVVVLAILGPAPGDENLEVDSASEPGVGTGGRR